MILLKRQVEEFRKIIQEQEQLLHFALEAPSTKSTNYSVNESRIEENKDLYEQQLTLLEESKVSFSIVFMLFMKIGNFR